MDNLKKALNNLGIKIEFGDNILIKGYEVNVEYPYWTNNNFDLYNQEVELTISFMRKGNNNEKI